MAEAKNGVTFQGDKGISAQHVEYIGSEKGGTSVVERVASDSSSLSHDEKTHIKPPTTARELVSEILLVEDDPTLNPFTFRMWFLGVGISVFAG